MTTMTGPLKTTSYYTEDEGDLSLSKQGRLWRIGLHTQDGTVEFEVTEQVAHFIGEFLEDAECQMCAPAAHECPTVPVWRPVIDGEDLTGYEVRSRDRDRDVWDAWGVAARRRNDGRWVTEGGWRLNGWPVVETTAPLPEPEPWDESLVEDVAGAIDHYDGFSDHELARSLLNLLADRGLIERPKAGA